MGVAVVTGGARGIGAATCRRFAAAGHDLVIGYQHAADAAAAIVAECVAQGVRAVAVAGDVGVEGTAADLFAAADGLGPVTILVNNAGIVAPVGRVDEGDWARVDRLFRVNVVGAFACAREAVQRMSTRHGGGGGAIVNISSGASRIGSPGEYVDYAATKGAIDTMTLGLAREVAAEGIRVNAVRPGLIDTELHATMGLPDRAHDMAPAIPIQRAADADEIAAVVAFLCSDDASYTTGALVDVTGGR